jgi:hypothetical protein
VLFSAFNAQILVSKHLEEQLLGKNEFRLPFDKIATAVISRAV